MSIKNVLITHSGSAGFPSGVGHATKIAAKHDAWLTAVYGSTSSYFEHVLGLTEELLDKLGNVRNEKIEAARAFLRSKLLRQEWPNGRVLLCQARSES